MRGRAGARRHAGAAAARIRPGEGHPVHRDGGHGHRLRDRHHRCMPLACLPGFAPLGLPLRGFQVGLGQLPLICQSRGRHQPLAPGPSCRPQPGVAQNLPMASGIAISSGTGIMEKLHGPLIVLCGFAQGLRWPAALQYPAAPASWRSCMGRSSSCSALPQRS